MRSEARHVRSDAVAIAGRFVQDNWQFLGATLRAGVG